MCVAFTSNYFSCEAFAHATDRNFNLTFGRHLCE
jgi:hypothetical protein